MPLNLRDRGLKIDRSPIRISRVPALAKLTIERKGPEGTHAAIPPWILTEASAHDPTPKRTDQSPATARGMEGFGRMQYLLLL